jgi:hypothetical protein
MPTTFKLLHPAFATSADESEVRHDAERYDTLTGHSAVLFSNNKPNVSPFHEELNQYLRQMESVSDVEFIQKSSAARPAEEAVMEHAKAFDFAVNAIAD